MASTKYGIEPTKHQYYQRGNPYQAQLVAARALRSIAGVVRFRPTFVTGTATLTRNTWCWELDQRVIIAMAKSRCVVLVAMVPIIVNGKAIKPNAVVAVKVLVSLHLASQCIPATRKDVDRLALELPVDAIWGAKTTVAIVCSIENQWICHTCQKRFATMQDLAVHYKPKLIPANFQPIWKSSCNQPYKGGTVDWKKRQPNYRISKPIHGSWLRAALRKLVQRGVLRQIKKN